MNDKSNITTLSGNLPKNPNDTFSPDGIDPKTKQMKDYWVLSEEERSKGFVRPVRMAYKHLPCNTITTMSAPLAETCARDPKFYGSAFCFECREHFPVSEFVWKDTTITMGD